MNANHFWIYIACVIFIVHIQQCFTYELFCNTAFNCTGQTIGGASFFTLVQARGYKSLSNSNVTNAQFLSCFGAYGCYDAIKLQAWDTLSAFGSNSGQNIERMESYTDISCYASNACQKSQMEAGNNIGCYGDQSCAQTNITAFKISALGAYSLYNSTIISTGDDEMAMFVYIHLYFM